MNNNVLMAVLFPGFRIDEMAMSWQNLVIKAHTTSRVATCPNCQSPSERVHSYYTRHPLDLPLAHFPVKLQLQVRRFRCLNDHCVKKTYAEQFPERQQRGKTPSILDPYITYLEKRQAEGYENAQQLWREIQAMGYSGKACQVTKWLQPRRTRPAPTAARKRRSKVERISKNCQLLGKSFGY